MWRLIVSDTQLEFLCVARIECDTLVALTDMKRFDIHEPAALFIVQAEREPVQY